MKLKMTLKEQVHLWALGKKMNKNVDSNQA